MPIQGGLTERQANTILVLLAKATPPITATKHKNTEGREPTWDIVVSSSDAPRAIELMQANNMPPKKDVGFEEIYGKSGMIPTATEERAKFMMALTGELQRTLKMIPGVLNARVHLMIPQEKLLRAPGEQQPLPEASVLITAKNPIVRAKTMRMNLEKDIKKIVAGGMERLKSDMIKVVIRSAETIEDTSSSTGSGSGADYNTVVMFRVAPGDANKLKMVLATMVAMLGVFIVLFLLFFFRSASLKNQLRASGNGSM